MEVLVCPHCGSPRIVHSKVPKDVVVVLPCPACHELVVLFRNRVIALSREIIEHGSFEERKDHIAGIIAEFLQAGIFPNHSGEEAEEDATDETPGADTLDADDARHKPMRSPQKPERRHGKVAAPIRQSEVDRFVKFDLLRIDDASYFKKHFG